MKRKKKPTLEALSKPVTPHPHPKRINGVLRGKNGFSVSCYVYSSPDRLANHTADEKCKTHLRMRSVPTAEFVLCVALATGMFHLEGKALSPERPAVPRLLSLSIPGMSRLCLTGTMAPGGGVQAPVRVMRPQAGLGPLGASGSAGAHAQAGHELRSLGGVCPSGRQLDISGEMHVGCAHRKTRESEGGQTAGVGWCIRK